MAESPSVTSSGSTLLVAAFARRARGRARASRGRTRGRARRRACDTSGATWPRPRTRTTRRACSARTWRARSRAARARRGDRRGARPARSSVRSHACLYSAARCRSVSSSSLSLLRKCRLMMPWLKPRLARDVGERRPGESLPRDGAQRRLDELLLAHFLGGRPPASGCALEMGSLLGLVVFGIFVWWHPHRWRNRQRCATRLARASSMPRRAPGMQVVE